jgi:hypothetical protein
MRLLARSLATGFSWTRRGRWHPVAGDRANYFVLTLIALLPLTISAQIPTATGKEIAMSNTAWKLFVPSTWTPTGTQSDILIHFHGDPATYRNNAKWANLNSLIVTVNYSGLSSAYSTPFSNTALFQTLLDEALVKARAESNIPDNLDWRKVGVTSFSAGYGAVREILKQQTYRDRIDCLLAADSLYASFTSSSDHTPLDSQMADYRAYAQLASQGSKTFIFSHSKVETYTYCTTGECADDLASAVGASFSAYSSTGLGTLDFYRKATKGNFTIYGANGATGDDHLEHLRYIGQYLQELPIATVPEPSAFGVMLLMGILKRTPRSQGAKDRDE